MVDAESCEAARTARSVWRDSIIKSTATQPARVIAAAISSTIDSTAKGADNDSVKPEHADVDAYDQAGQNAHHRSET